MTEETITVEETVEQEHTVCICDRCGLGPDVGGKGEIRELDTPHLNEDEIWHGLDGVVRDEPPEIHMHERCIDELADTEYYAEDVDEILLQGSSSIEQMSFVLERKDVATILCSTFVLLWMIAIGPPLLIVAVFLFVNALLWVVVFSSGRLAAKEVKDSLYG